MLQKSESMLQPVLRAPFYSSLHLLPVGFIQICFVRCCPISQWGAEPWSLIVGLSTVSLVESICDLLNRADQQLISRLSLGRIDGVGRQLQYAACLTSQVRDSKSAEILDKVNHLIALIEVDQIKRK